VPVTAWKIVWIAPVPQSSRFRPLPPCGKPRDPGLPQRLRFRPPSRILLARSILSWSQAASSCGRSTRCHSSLPVTVQTHCNVFTQRVTIAPSGTRLAPSVSRVANRRVFALPGSETIDDCHTASIQHCRGFQSRSETPERPTRIPLSRLLGRWIGGEEVSQCTTNRPTFSAMCTT